MKLDSEPLFVYKPLFQKLDFKPFQHTGNALDVSKSKVSHGVLKKNENQIEEDLKGFEGITDHLPFFHKENKNEIVCADLEDFEEDYSVNKSVTEYEPREMNICMDEVMASHDRITITNNKDKYLGFGDKTESSQESIQKTEDDIGQKVITPENMIRIGQLGNENLITDSSRADGNEAAIQSFQILNEEVKIEESENIFDKSSTLDMPSLEEIMKSDETFNDSNQLQRCLGETSFSVTEPITYSGPISYLGNASFRSESSTTSAHSFAFPIMQSEWNSSPVRMRKANRRHFPKHKGWMQGFLCCKF